MVQVPAGASGSQQLRGEVEYQFVGMANPASLYAGPDPLIVAPVPGAPFIVSFNLSSEGAAQIVVAGRKGSTYYLDASDSLVTWSRVSTNINTEGTVRFLDEGALSQHPTRFYRVVEAH